MRWNVPRKTRAALARALFGMVLTVAGTSRAQGPTQATRSQRSAPSIDAGSKAKFAEALRLYRAGKYEAALPLFTEIADTTRSPNARLYIGHCLVQLGKQADAYRAFSLTVKEIVDRPAEKYEPTREAAQAQLEILNVRVAKLVILVPDVPPGLAIALDGTAVPERDFGSSLVLEPGAHQITGGSSGFQPIRRDVTIEAGESKAVHVSLKRLDEKEPVAAHPTSEPAPAPTSGHGNTTRTLGYVAGGVGIAGIAAFAIAGIAAKSTYDGLERDCAGGCSDSGHLDDVNRGKSLQSVANVGLVVGAVGLAVGGTLLLVGGRERQTPAPTVSFYPGGGSISFRGNF